MRLWTQGLIAFHNNPYSLLPTGCRSRKAWDEVRTMTHSILVFLRRRALPHVMLFLAVAPLFGGEPVTSSRKSQLIGQMVVTAPRHTLIGHIVVTVRQPAPPSAAIGSWCHGCDLAA